MIPFQTFTLDNGLQVVVHEDPHCLLATVNIMYHVGSKDESAQLTGLAHLFEHLMFGGSKHIPSYDQALQQVGGDNNAYTTPDVTNYYCTLPAANLETAFWLESDRMLSLAFDPQALAVQQKVVIEEFKETQLNQPYGDAWHHLIELAYTQHAYRWPVIGQQIDHIAQVTMHDVKDFFKRFYVPNNAVLVVAGNVTLEQVKQLSQKWFGPIPAGPTVRKNLPQEPIQKAARSVTCHSDVPLDALYKAFSMPGRLHEDYYAAELLCSTLSAGKSARLYERLVEKQPYFNAIGAYMTETVDPGLFVVIGRLNEGVRFDEADQALTQLLEEVRLTGLTTQELEKVKNHAAAYRVNMAVDLLHRAQELAFGALLGNPNLVNEEMGKIQKIGLPAVQAISQHILSPKNTNTLYYQSQTR